MLRRSALCAVVALSGVSASVATSFHNSKLVTTTIEPIMSTTIPSPEECHISCIPNLCTGDATMDGAVTHLTYLCPTASTISKLRKTIYVTVTITEEVTPTITSVVARPLGDTASSAEPTTTVTLHKTDTLTKTITLQRVNPSHVQAAPEAVTVITRWSSFAPSDIATPIFSIAPVSPHNEPISVITESDIESYSKTETVIQTIIVSPIPIPSSFPTITLSANGSTTEGIFFSHSARNSSFHPTVTGGYAISLHDRGFTPRGTDGPIMTITSTVYINVTTGTPHHPTSTPTAAYPGAVTQALGKKGGAGIKAVSFWGLVVVEMLAVLIL